MVCVATVSKVDTDKGMLLIHFDGWRPDYDYSCEYSSTDIHPMGWCKQTKHKLEKPKGKVWMWGTHPYTTQDCVTDQLPAGYSGDFNWERYLQDEYLIAAPSSLFTSAQKS